MTAGVVVFAVGNRSRGDDAIGPLLLERLDAWLAGDGRGADFELIDDFQLQIEHALDLAGRRLALFIDAGDGHAAPVRTARDRGRRTAAAATARMRSRRSRCWASTGRSRATIRRRRSCCACAASASSSATDLSDAAHAHVERSLAAARARCAHDPMSRTGARRRAGTPA